MKTMVCASPGVLPGPVDEGGHLVQGLLAHGRVEGACDVPGFGQHAGEPEAELVELGFARSRMSGRRWLVSMWKVKP